MQWMSMENISNINADSVIMSVRYKPAPIVEKSKHVHIIGVALQVSNLRTVIWNTWDVAMKRSGWRPFGSWYGRPSWRNIVAHIDCEHSLHTYAFDRKYKRLSYLS